MKTLTEFIPLFAKRYRIAVQMRGDFKSYHFSYKELSKKIMQCTTLLENKGVKKGDRVLLWAPNGPEWVISYFAILARGAIVVPIDMLATKEHAEGIATHAQPSLSLQTMYKPALIKKSATLHTEQLFAQLTKTTTQSPFICTPQDVATIVYTSGTTGTPKGVLLTHENLLSNIAMVTKQIKISQQDHFVSLLPLSHMFEQTAGMLTPLQAGGTITYLETIKPKNILLAIKEEPITVFMAVPRILMSLQNGIQKKVDASWKKYLFKGLFAIAKNSSRKMRQKLFGSIQSIFGPQFRFFVSGGAPLPLETQLFWKRMGFKVLEGYGLTECSPIVSVNPEKKQKLGSVGIPVPGVTLRHTKEGEVQVKGKNVFKGYYKNEQGTREVLQNNWFSTGDLGYTDKEGYVYIQGRKKEVIIGSSGMNVFPSDIEDNLNKQPGVQDSCVVGIKKQTTEQIHAVLILQSGARPQTIIEQVNAQAPPHQQIESFSVWPEKEFPKTPTLKIKKHIIKDQLEEQGKINPQQQKLAKLTPILEQFGKIPSNYKPRTSLKKLAIPEEKIFDLIRLLEQTFHCDLDETKISLNTSLQQLLKYIEERKPGAPVRSKPALRNIFLGEGIQRTWNTLVHKGIGSYLLTNITVKNSSVVEQLTKPVIFVMKEKKSMYVIHLLRALSSQRAAATRWIKLHTKKGTPLSYETLTMPTHHIPFAKQKKGSLEHLAQLIKKNRTLVFTNVQEEKTKKQLWQIADALQVVIIPVTFSGAERKATLLTNITLSFETPLEPHLLTEKSLKKQLESL